MRISDLARAREELMQRQHAAVSDACRMIGVEPEDEPGHVIVAMNELFRAGFDSVALFHATIRGENVRRD